MPASDCPRDVYKGTIGILGNHWLGGENESSRAKHPCPGFGVLGEEQTCRDMQRSIVRYENAKIRRLLPLHIFIYLHATYLYCGLPAIA